MSDPFDDGSFFDQYPQGGTENFRGYPSPLSPDPGHPNATSTKFILKQSFAYLQSMIGIRNEMLTLRNEMIALNNYSDIAAYPARP